MATTEEEIEKKKKELRELEQKLNNEKLHAYIDNLGLKDGNYIRCSDNLCGAYYFRYFENAAKFEETHPLSSLGSIIGDHELYDTNKTIIRMTVQTHGLYESFTMMSGCTNITYPIIIDFDSQFEIDRKIKKISKEEYERIINSTIEKLEDLKK